MSKPTRSSVKTNIPEGDYAAVCKIVADLGTVESSNPDWKPRKVIKFLFELVELSTKNEVKYVTKDYTFTAKSKGLKELCKRWKLGVKNPAEYDFADCVGMPATVEVVHSEDGSYANIEEVRFPDSKIRAKGFMPEVSVFLDKSFNVKDFEKLPEWLQSKMMDAEEFDEATRGKRVTKKSRDDDDDEDEKPSRSRNAKPARRRR